VSLMRIPAPQRRSARATGPAAVGPFGDPRRLRGWLTWICLIAGALLIPEVVGVVLACRAGRPHGPPPGESADAGGRPDSPAEDEVAPLGPRPALPTPPPGPGAEPHTRPPAPKPPDQPPPPEPPPDPPPPWLPAEEQDRVNRAVGRGVDFLNKTQNPDGGWTASDLNVDRFPLGLTALPGLTLLECGAAPDDAHVRKAADFVRKRAPECGQTYELALGILFLDRLGDRADEPLIRSMALRLVAGQTAGGGWTYGCPVLAPKEEADLLAALKAGAPAAGADLPEPAADDADHSNTQFAVLGLWAARRHDAPADRALARAARRFRACQADDGTWGYYFDRQRSKGTTSPSMTAAGLLGLAAGRAVGVNGAAPRGEDPAVEKGMRALGAWVGGGGRLGDVTVPGAALLGKLGPASEASAAMTQAMDLYFLWSVERVGVLFNRRSVGGKEWYPWGARLLLDAQQGNGGWGKRGSMMSAPAVDTCFALLFLKRADLARGLSDKLDLGTPTEAGGGSPVGSMRKGGAMPDARPAPGEGRP